ncbi:hypothetical protein BH10ACI1_BH10ACI1_04100 [soil metagenome]
MSDMVTVDIKTPHNEILEGSQLPLDYSVQMILDELIDSLGLSRLDESARPIGYILRSGQQGRALTNNETVMTAQIRNGDMLELQSMGATVSVNGDMPLGMPPIPPQSGNNYVTGGGNNYAPPPTVALPNTSEINVVLSVMDLNRHENVSLAITRPVGDLIKQIVANYNLPSRDNLNQLIKYKLQSKALGRFLDERMTLLEAQIPPLDRLTLHRDEIAG